MQRLGTIAKVLYIFVLFGSLVGCVLSILAFTCNSKVYLYFSGVVFELCLLFATIIIANALLRMRGNRYKSEFSLSIVSGQLLFAAYLISDLAAGMFFTMDTQYKRYTLFYYALFAMIVCYFLSNLGLLVIMIQISSMQLKYEQ